MTESLGLAPAGSIADAAGELLALFRTSPSGAAEAAMLARQYLDASFGAGWAVDLNAEDVSITRGDGCDEQPPPDVLDALTEWVRLVRQRDRYRDDLQITSAESESQSRVADEILSIRDLGQVLLSIVNRTIVLLDSDICGVLLRDGDVIQMKACVGNRIVETANLTMQRGQGLAGLVFATGEHGRVDNYVDDRTISPDFVSLAEQEETKSALAVPLLAHGEVFGVLEVWRRRMSTFTEADVRRMLALAALASIAIENAHLYDAQALTLTRLTAAHESLEQHVARLDRSVRVQTSLLRLVLDHVAAYEQIMKTIADEYGCRAIYARETGTIEACYPPLGETPSGALPSLIIRNRTHREPVLRVLKDGRRMWTQAVVVGDHEVGSVNLIGGDDSEEAMRSAVTQGAMACALARLEQRAASEARNAAFEQIIWDLVEGPPDHRSAALSRADELGLMLHGPHRILRGTLENFTELAQLEGWDTAAAEQARRAVLHSVKKSEVGSKLRLVSIRGDWIVGILAAEGAQQARDAVSAITAAARGAVPGLQPIWGVSSAHHDPLQYHDAHREAVAALTGAQRMQAGECSLYDELGIVRLLLGGVGVEADLQHFVDDVTGPLREYDIKHDGALVRTLRAFFDNDCSQRRAAEALFIHPKTLSYRLGQISELSGLDLQLHADRVRADLALRMLQLMESTLDVAEPAS